MVLKFSAELRWKLYVSTKFSHQDITRNLGISCSDVLKTANKTLDNIAFDVCNVIFEFMK